MSEHIYTILASKKHNPHFLKRYVKFIDACLAKNQNLSSDVYVEQHHICPKDKDLFPEFKSFKTYPWNKAVLTARQHYIAHQMLMKAYGGGQIYAFVAMNKQSRKSSNQTERYRKPNSTFYAKKANNEWMSESRKGKAAYVDENGETFYVRTDDPRVSLGELKSMTKGRVHKKYTPEERKARKRLFQEKVKNVPKFGNIYFLEFKLKVDKRSEKFIELLEQG